VYDGRATVEEAIEQQGKENERNIFNCYKVTISDKIH
jgi:hypothetical protein